MKLFAVLLKKELFSAFIKPPVYIASVLLSVVPALIYFIGTRFFTYGAGSSDLHVFFTAIPQCAVLAVPAITMPLWNKTESRFDASLPVSDTLLVMSKWAAAYISYCAAIAASVIVPIIVSCYGDIEAGQVLSGYSGILLFGTAACALGVCASLWAQARAVSFLVTALILAAVSSIQFLPMYIGFFSFFESLCQYLSFSWHFDAAGKGIIDSRDAVFYITLTVLFIAMAVFRLHAKRCARLSLPARLIRVCAVVCAVLVLLCSQRLYVRLDLTHAQQFSVSPETETVLSELSQPLHITYYLSDQLRRRYPEIRDVSDFLYKYADSGTNITVSVVSDRFGDSLALEYGDMLAMLGIREQQIQTANTNSIEFISVYSAIVLEYGDKTAVLPFVLAVPGLEYELTSRVKALAQNMDRRFFAVAGNGRSLIADYGIALQWLEQAGFVCQPLSVQEVPDRLDDAMRSGGRPIPLVIFGSSSFTEEQAAAVERYAAAGASVFCAVSPITADAYETWNAQLNTDDALLAVLDTWGFGFLPSLIQDASCFRLQLGTGDETHPEYLYRNYPLWPNILPQYCTEHPIAGAITAPITLFWASPLVITPQAEQAAQVTYLPLMYTTPAAYVQEADYDTGRQFLTDPFQLGHTGSAQTPSQYMVAAAAEDRVRDYYIDESAGNSMRAVVVSGDLTTASVTLSYTGSSGNLDFLINSLLWLNYEDDMLAVRNKLPPNTALYKTDAAELAQTQAAVLCTVIIVPLVCMGSAAGIVCAIRKRAALYETDTAIQA